VTLFYKKKTIVPKLLFDKSVAPQLPEPVKSHIFHYRASNKEWARLKAKSLAEATFPLDPEERPISSLLSILYSYQELSDSELVTVARNMGVDTNTIALGGVISGRLGILEEIKISAEELKNTVIDNHYLGFNLAVCNQSISVFNFLITLLTTDEQRAMIMDKNNQIFYSAIKNNNRAVFKIIKKLMALEDLRGMIAKSDYNAFWYASLQMKESFFKIINPEKHWDMISADDNSTLKFAVLNNDIAMVQYLFSKTTKEQWPLMLSSGIFFAFREAAQRGFDQIVDYLLQKVSAEQLLPMIMAEKFQAFLLAAEWGHLTIVELLIRWIPKAHLMTMIQFDGFKAFFQSLRKGHLSVVECLLRQVSQEKLWEMIGINHFEAFRLAARKGYLTRLVNILFESASIDHIDTIVSDKNNLFSLVVEDAVDNGSIDHEAVKRLMSFPAIFQYMEYNSGKYGNHFVKPFVMQQLQLWYHASRVTDQTNPDQGFDLTGAREQRLGFFMARFLIRCHDPVVLDDLRFLLSIPSIRALSTKAVTPNRPNELFRLALMIGNQGAVSLLMELVEVRVLAEQNHFYANEDLAGPLDMSEIMSMKKGRKSVSGEIIKSPENDSIYDMKSTYSAETVSITFEGSSLPDEIEVDVTKLNRMTPVFDSISTITPFSFVSMEMLPIGFLPDSSLPRLYIHNNPQIYAITNLNLTYKSGSRFEKPGLRMEWRPIPGVENLIPYNETLQAECQNIAGNIPVNVAENMIFKPARLPSLSFLTKLYEQFWGYNKDRLDDQLNNSKNLCHIRAHFVSTILHVFYGIESVKLFKRWEPVDWNGYDKKDRWTFHCATMVPASKGNPWVWDPWIGNHAKLLSLQEWLFDNQSPKPIELVIGNRGVLGFRCIDNVVPTLSFDGIRTNAYRYSGGTAFGYYRGVFQAIFNSAIPNPPQRAFPFLGNTFAFFNRSKRVIESQGRGYVSCAVLNLGLNQDDPVEDCENRTGCSNW
jgi:hypothetical protein